MNVLYNDFTPMWKITPIGAAVWWMATQSLQQVLATCNHR